MTNPSEASASVPPGSGQATGEGGPAPWLAMARAGRVLAFAAPFLVYALAPGDLSEHARLALAIASFALVSWMTHALDHAITGLIACYLFWALRVVPFHTAFEGFGTPIPWLAFAAMLYGMMATKSGLARRLAYQLMRAAGHSYSRVLLGLVVAGFLVTFLVPSGVPRVVLLAVVALGLIEAFGMGPGSNVGRGMFVLLSCTTPLFGRMMMAGTASFTARELIEQVGQVEVLWSRWLLAFLPFDLILIFAAWRLTLWLYPPEQKALSGGAGFPKEELGRMGPWTTLEKRTALLGSVAVGLWMTDAFHHIPAPLIGIGVGLAAALPFFGVLKGAIIKNFNFLPLLFVGSAISVSEVLIETKALDGLAGFLTTAVAPYLQNAWSSTLVLYWTAFVHHILIGEEISMLSASLPALMETAQGQGLNTLPIGMIWTFAAGGKIFVYQSAVLIVGYSYGYFDGRDLLRVGMALAVVQSLVLFLVAPLYWPLLGL